MSNYPKLVTYVGILVVVLVVYLVNVVGFFRGKRETLIGGRWRTGSVGD